MEAEMPYLSVEMENVIVSNYSGGGSPSVRDGDRFVFQPQATGEPSGGEDIIRLPDDVIIDASTDPFVGPLNPYVDLSSSPVDEGHAGGANFAMYDGSVRFYNPYITVDCVEGI
jgi:prepilin-type processing-associated H-X9-DG protein